jgi:hypothetical protein
MPPGLIDAGTRPAGPVAVIAAARADGYGLGLEPGAPPAGARGWRGVQDVEGLPDRVARATAVAGSAAVAATWILEKHAWLVAGLALAGMLRHRAIPDLGALLLHDADEGWPDALAVLDGACWLPAADGRDLAEHLEVHFAPVIGALSRHRAEKPLWRSAGDRIGQAATWCGAAFGDPGGARALAVAALDARTALHAPSRFEDGMRVRSGCCLAHRVAGMPRCDDCANRPAAAT